MRTRRKPLAAVAAAILSASCAVGPDFNRPAAPTADGYTREALPEKTTSADVAGGEEQRFLGCDRRKRSSTPSRARSTHPSKRASPPAARRPRPRFRRL